MADITVPQEILTQLHSDFTSLATKHATTSFAALGVLVIVLILAGLGGWIGLREYDAQLAKAQVTEQKYEAAQKTLTDLLASDAKERAQLQAQQQSLVNQIAKRDKTPPAPAVTAALQPNATAETAANALGLVFSLSPYPSATIDNKIALSVPNAQELISDGVELNKLRPDLTDTKMLYGLEQQKSASLNKDIVQCTDTLKDAQKSIAAYKKIATRSRWKKFLDGAEKVGLVIAGAAIGHVV
jgi:hypothetical protein